MTARFPAQDPARGREPQAAPRTPRKPGDGALIDELVRKLRDELGLAIAPRDQLYSPSKSNKSQADRLYSRIQTLFWQEHDTLEAIIKECRADFAGQWSLLSAEGRNDHLFRKLNDPAWFTANRIRQPLLHASPGLRRTSANPRPAQRSFQRVDSGVGTASPSTPDSPLAKKTMAEKANDNSKNAADSFRSRRSSTFDDTTTDTTAKTTPNTSFSNSIKSSADDADDEGFGGSSVFSQWEGPTPGFPEGQITESITPATNLGHTPAKRRRSDNVEEVETPKKKIKQEPQQFSESPTKLPEPHWQLKDMAKSGLVLDTYGSSFTVSQAEKPHTGQQPKIFSSHTQKNRHPAVDLVQSPAKRKRSDEFEGLLETPSKKLRVQPLRSPRTSNLGNSIPWKLRNLVEDGLGADPETDINAYWEEASASRNITQTCVLRGTIVLNSKRQGSLIQTKLDPLRWDNQSSRAQRRFGPDRFLILTAPSFTTNLPSDISGPDQVENRRLAFDDWLSAPKNFMGREWYIFHVENLDQRKMKKTAKGKKDDTLPVREFWLFATQGLAISKKVTIFDLLNWMFPFRENAKQPVCKSFARFLLSIKHSIPSINFKPSQVMFDDDILANSEPEDTSFEDPSFRRERKKCWKSNEVMTDGCAMISVGAAELIRETLGIDEHPSVFQGRINGAKGMWSISAPYGTSDSEHKKIWIQIRESQRKIEPRKEDLDDSSCEKDRWSFDLKGYSRPPRVAHLHKDFLPVLEDRHVPSEALLDIVKEGVKPPIAELREMLDDPAKLVLWRQRCYPAADEHFVFDEPGLPVEPSRKACLFVERAGYMPHEHPIIADAFERMVEAFLQNIRYNHRFFCLKSTLLPGIADPYGKLKPGEIHLILSQPLKDEITGERFSMFADKDVLVGRDPTIRGSDIQKVRCIRHTDLAHLIDVVVFSSKGQIPLAAKLQGGDYDGDRFWVCADERLVVPFLNAPVLEQRGIGFFGIQKETRTLEEIVSPEEFGTEEHATAFLRIVLPIACRDKPLGLVTNYCNDLSYNRHKGRGLWDDGVAMIADLHDLIIDADKNGYLYGMTEFAQFRRKKRLPEESFLGRREYDLNLNAAKLRNENGYNNETKLLTILAKGPRYKTGHILDRVIFEIVNPPFLAYLEYFQNNVVKAAEQTICDPDLEFQYKQLESKAPRRRPINLHTEVQALKQPLQEILQKLKLLWPAKPEEFKDALSECIDLYDRLQPTDPDDAYWDKSIASSVPNPWDCFKLAVFSREHKYKAVFWIARDMVCEVKKLSTSGRNNLEQIQRIMKPTRPKEWKRADTSDALSMADIEDSDFETDLDESLFDLIS